MIDVLDEQEKILADNPGILKSRNQYVIGGFLASVTFLLYWTYIDANRLSVYRVTLNKTSETEVNNESVQNPVSYLRNSANKSKTILVWCGVYTFQHTVNLTVKYGRYQCMFTRDRRMLSESDAVLMVNGYIQADDLPPLRFPWQRWIFKSTESPLNHRPPRALNGKINWTMTYHHSSDIPHQFGFYREIGSNDFGPFKVSMLQLCRPIQEDFPN